MKPVGEYLHSELREPTQEAAQMFQNLAAKSKDIENENKTEGKTKKFWCMACCVENEFPDTDTALEGTCKKCGNPIFEETKT